MWLWYRFFSTREYYISKLKKLQDYIMKNVRDFMKRRMDAGRTDLALELAEGFEEMEVEKGVLMKVEFSKNQKLKKTIIRIINEEGEKLLKKGKGLYIHGDE